MKILTVFAVTLSSLLALAIAYVVARYQRRRRYSVAVFPLRATAILAGVVSLSAWLEILETTAAVLAWFSTVALPVAMLLGRRAIPSDLFSTSQRMHGGATHIPGGQR